MWNTWDRIFLGFAFQQVVNAIENGPREPTPPWLIEQERKRKEQATKRRVERRRALKQLATISGAVMTIYALGHLLSGTPAGSRASVSSATVHHPWRETQTRLVPPASKPADVSFTPEQACRMAPDLLGVCRP